MRLRVCLFLFAACLTAWRAPCALGQDERAVDLDALPARLPFRTLPNALPAHPYAGELAPNLVTCDLDRDGWDEAVTVINDGFIGLDLEGASPGVLWQHNVPPAYVAPPRSVWLGATADVTGDGRPEIFATAERRGAYPARLWVFDAVAQRVVSDTELPAEASGASAGGAAADHDGCGELRWICPFVLNAGAGGAAPGGGVGGAAADGRPLAILAGVGDAGSGALLALDPLSGRVAWHLDLPGRLEPTSLALADLDGDKVPEIVLATSAGARPADAAPSPPTGTAVGAVLAVDGAGRTLWAHDFGSPAHAWASVADLDGDGDLEVAFAADPREARDKGEVGVLAGRSGTLLVRKTLASGALGIALRPRQGHGFVYVGLRGGGIGRYRYDPGRLAVDRRAVSTRAGRVVALVDVLPGLREPALLALLARGGALLLDPELAPLCELDLPVAGLQAAHARVWNAGPRARYLFIDAAATRGFVFARNETFVQGLAHRAKESPATAALAAAGLLAAAGAAATLLLRRRAAIARRHDPELWARLLRASQVASHGEVSATKALQRRLPPLLEAIAASAPPPPAVVAQAHDAWQALRETDAPRLHAILRLARAVGVAPEIVGPVREGLNAALACLRGMFDAGLDPEHVGRELPRLEAAVQAVSSGLLRIRACADPRFHADMRAVLDQARAARDGELRQAGVDVAVVAPGFDGGPVLGVIPPSDLLFILDNLLGNAARAMSGHDGERRLRVNLIAGDGLVDVFVADTGPGVPPKRREAIFAGDSDRQGGGIALSRGRETARAWGGDLALMDAEPGEGATFRLTVAKVRSMEVRVEA